MAILQVVKGPNVGRCYELTANESVLGRYPFCDVVLPSHTVSRQHARIVQAGGAYFVEDLNSLNGTFLNGERVARRTPLKNQDRIRIYEILLIFFEGKPDLGYAIPADELPDDEPAEKLIETASSQPAAVADVFNLRQDRPGSACQTRLHEVASATRHLQQESSGELPMRIVDALFTLFPQADHAHVLLRDASQELVLKATKSRHEEAESTMTLAPMSLSLANRSMSRGEAVLNVVEADAENGDSVLSDTSKCAMMCAPLIGPTRTPLGTMHIKTSHPAMLFTKDDLEVLVSVGMIAGQAVEFAPSLDAST